MPPTSSDLDSKNKYYKPSRLLTQDEERTAGLVAVINEERERGNLPQAEKLEKKHFGISSKERK